MLFGSQLPPAALLTWFQLASLTWCGQESHTFDIQAWVDFTGTSRNTFLRHIRLLQSRHLLRRDFPTLGMVRVSFEGIDSLYRPQARQNAEQVMLDIPPRIERSELDGIPSSAPKMVPPKMVPPKMGSPNLPCDSGVNPLSLNPPSPSLIPVSESGIQELTINLTDEKMREGEGVSEGESKAINILRTANSSHNRRSTPPQDRVGNPPGLPGDHPPEPTSLLTHKPISVKGDDPDPVSIYRVLMHLTPNAIQRQALASSVHDLERWQASLEHWAMHSWNPRNLVGMLELYERGGPEGCRHCQVPAASKQPQARPMQTETPHEQTLAAIAELRGKHTSTGFKGE
jgi:hypothetical protein